MSFVVSGLMLACSLSGCSSKKPWEIVYPAKGVVTLKGKPIGDASIMLFSQDTNVPESVRPQARSKEDGTFEVGTYGVGDGAPAGSYKVVVLHYPIIGLNAGPNDLPAKYAKVDTTDLIVEIGQGKEQLPPLELK